MRAEAIVAVIWLLVFVIGVVVGVIAIIALSTIRKDGNDRHGPDPEDDRWPERDHGVSGIPGRWEGGERPRWPDGWSPSSDPDDPDHPDTRDD
jgi:hypothetical protein